MPELFNHYLKNDANLQGYWRLNGDYIDLSPNAYTLTPSGSPTDVLGVYDRAKLFVRASNQYASVAGANLRQSGDQSFGGWIYLNTVGIDQRLFGVADATPTNWINVIVSGATDLATMQGTGLSAGSTSTTVFKTAIWYHVVGILDNTNLRLKIYVNGREESNVSITNSHNGGTGDFAIGRMGAYNADYVDGRIDDVFFFNRVLSANEVKSIYNNYQRGLNYLSSTSENGISVTERYR